MKTTQFSVKGLGIGTPFALLFFTTTAWPETQLPQDQPSAAVASPEPMNAGPTERYPIMRFDSERKLQILRRHLTAARISVPTQSPEALPPSVNLISHLPYVPADRDQGSCNDCWQWVGTGVMEIAHDVQNGVHNRLSVQFINSCNARVPCCTGGWIDEFTTFYTTAGFAVPWANTNAQFTSGGGTCAPCENIDPARSYSISSISTVTIPTHKVGQEQAIANIKFVLNRHHAIWFGFFLPTYAAWDDFFTFWETQPEQSVWNSFSCGQTPDRGEGGHAALCVGYNEEDPNNRYWVMVNSWGTADGLRSNGVFRVSMDIDYDCAYPSGWPTLYWQTLGIQFAQPNGMIALSGDLSFGSSTVGVPEQRVLTISNSSSSIVDVFGIDCPAGFAGAWSGSIMAGGSQNVTVTFTPTAGISYNGSITIKSDAAGGTSSLAISGTGMYVFKPVPASYSGLFYEIDSVRHQSSGAFTLVTTATGRFSGNLQAAGQRYSISGSFDTNGAAQIAIPRPGMSPLSVALRFDLASGLTQLTGSVSDGNWRANLFGFRAGYDGKTNLAPQAGQYTLVIAGGSDSAAVPGGDGYATAIVDKAGGIVLAGTLADGTKISQVGTLLANEHWPFYVSLYGGNGSILGWLTFTNDLSQDTEGTVSWIKLSSANLKSYPDGFALETTASGSRYTKPVPPTNVLNSTSGQIILSGGNLVQEPRDPSISRRRK